MTHISRRHFLAGAAAAGALAFSNRFARAADPTAKIEVASGTDVVTLGRSGVKPSVLGMGTGAHGGNEPLGLGQDAFVKMIRHGLDRGIRYIDTADMYGTHLFLRFALEGVPRDKYFLLTKTRAKHPEVAKADIERFRRELRVPYIDCLLMHCMTSGTWPTEMRPVMDALHEAKEKGHVKAVGVSCHGWDPLVASVDCDWIDVQLARINPYGMKMDGTAEQVAPILKKMHDKGRGVLGMKIYGESGFDSAEKRLESLKYVLGLGSVDAFTIGFTNAQQIDETLDLIAQAAQAVRAAA